MNLFEVLNHPSMLHAAVVHLPIALSLAGLLLIVACGIFEESLTLRRVTLVTFVLLVLTAQYAIISGENSRTQAPNDLSQRVWDLINEHESLARQVRNSALITLAFVAFTLAKHKEFRKAMLLIGGLGGFSTVLLVAITAHVGGNLVYDYGVGTALIHQQARGQEATPGAASTATPAVTGQPAGDPRPAQGTAEAPFDPFGQGGTPPVPMETLLPIRDIDPELAKTVDFKRDVWPIISEHCLECHESPDPDGGLDLTTVDNMLKSGDKAGPGVVPGDPDHSAIVQYIRGIVKPRMPHKEPPLDPDTLHTIRMWIFAGAKPSPGEAPPAGAVTPEQAAPSSGPVFNPFG
ncbi:MAG: hypothetical protein HYV26_13135 [Candidatus Hydrogenedentes bacterium]|nr:hypothetical protein [Candidatus Hydrogenedentota bacterium]